MQPSASPQRASARLALSDDLSAPVEAADWIGPLLALGARASRYRTEGPSRQLVVALSVPRRDFAAALIGCGWVMASESPTLLPPLELLRSIQPGTPIRAVNEREVIAGNFGWLNESVSPPRAQFAGSTWLADRLKAVAELPALESAARTPRPIVGTVGRMAGIDKDWEARLAAPAADLA